MLQLQELSLGNWNFNCTIIIPKTSWINVLKRFWISYLSEKTLISRELTFVLPYLGKLSLDLRTRLRQTIKRDLPYCKLKIIFRSKCRLSATFIPEWLNTWGSLILLTGKHLKNIELSAISDHLLQCNCTINFDDFSILAADCNKFKFLLREFVNKTWQTYFKQDDEIISTRTLWLRWQFYFQYNMIARFRFNI